MCLCIKHERIVNAVLLATHDAVIHVQGGSRFTSTGRKLKPLSASYAAEITGHTEKHIRNCLDPNQEGHQLSLRSWVLMLLAGMDRSPVDELERALSYTATRNPEPHEHASLQSEVLAAGKEFGDVCDAIATALDENSHGGQRITRRELDGIAREVDEVVTQMHELLDAVRDETKRPRRDSDGETLGQTARRTDA